MAAESNEKLMLNWFQMQTLKSLQEQQKTGILDSPLLLKTVEKAISRSFERISGARNASLIFDLDTHRLVLDFESADGNAQKFAMEEMSDGYKNTLSMIGDIAYRMAVLNPTLGDQVLEKTPGVVLIDEIDLHLHPQWQQTILTDLHAIFPEVQFIVSSHAPAVINSVPREQIRILDHGEIYMPAAQTYGRDANSILREVMNVSERPADIKQRVDLFYAHMDEKNYKEADKVRMAVLNPTLGDQVLEKTPGVVLIDEIDLHLHPQWQQTILSDLHAIFPEVQFIVSSHAPAVINSVPREQIRILDQGEIYMPVAQTYGRDANSILREVMNVSERPADIKHRMDLFYAYMDEKNYKEADKVLTEMEAIVGTTDPDIVAARTSLDLERILGE